VHFISAVHYHQLIDQLTGLNLIVNNRSVNYGIKVWGFFPKNPTYKSAKYLISDSMAALVRHSQAQNCTLNLCIKLL